MVVGAGIDVLLSSTPPVDASGIDGDACCNGSAAIHVALRAQEELCKQMQALLRQHQQDLEQHMDDWMATQRRLLQSASPATPSSAGPGPALPSSKEVNTSQTTLRTPTLDRSNTSESSLCPLQVEDKRRQEVARRLSTGRAMELTPASRPGCFRAFMSSTRSELLSAILIFTNSIFIGVEVEYSARSSAGSSYNAFFWINCLYTLLFAMELIARIAAQGRHFCRSVDWKWNIVDVVVVLTSLVELALTSAYQWDDLNASNVRILRVLRVVRLIRALRITRVLRFFGGLRTMVMSIFATFKSLVWVLFLLVLVMYVFAIVFTQCAIDYMADTDGWDPALAVFWGGLEASMLTLFKSISGGLSWHEALLPLADISRVLVWLFCVYIFLTYFEVLNVVTGVFCHSAIENAANDPEVLVQSLVDRKKEYMQKVKNLFQDLGTGDPGSITLEELEACLSNENLSACFVALGIDTDDAWQLFKLLDTDKTNVVDIEEFVWGCMRLRGSATAVDMYTLLHDNKWLAKKLAKLTSYVEEQFQTLQSPLRAQ